MTMLVFVAPLILLFLLAGLAGLIALLIHPKTRAVTAILMVCGSLVLGLGIVGLWRYSALSYRPAPMVMDGWSHEGQIQRGANLGRSWGAKRATVSPNAATPAAPQIPVAPQMAAEVSPPAPDGQGTIPQAGGAETVVAAPADESPPSGPPTEAQHDVRSSVDSPQVDSQHAEISPAKPAAKSAEKSAEATAKFKRVVAQLEAVQGVVIELEAAKLVVAQLEIALARARDQALADLERDSRQTRPAIAVADVNAMDGATEAKPVLQARADARLLPSSQAGAMCPLPMGAGTKSPLPTNLRSVPGESRGERKGDMHRRPAGPRQGSQVAGRGATLPRVDSPSPNVAQRAAKIAVADITPVAAAKRPEWVDAGPRRVGDAYQTQITVGPYSTRLECDTKLPDALQAAVADFLETYLGPEWAGRIRLPEDDVQQLVKEQWEEPIQASFGPMMQLHVLLEFDHKVRDRIKQERDDAIAIDRLWCTGAGVGGGLLLLTILYLLLKIDLRTAGAYRGRLSFAAILLAIVVAVVGTKIVRTTLGPPAVAPKTALITAGGANPGFQVEPGVPASVEQSATEPTAAYLTREQFPPLKAWGVLIPVAAMLGLVALAGLVMAVGSRKTRMAGLILLALGLLLLPLVAAAVVLVVRLVG